MLDARSYLGVCLATALCVAVAAHQRDWRVQVAPRRVILGIGVLLSATIVAYEVGTHALEEAAGAANS